MDETMSAKSQRMNNPKVRTGCITCKERRVKCDEAKPTCRRCEKASIPCKGYRPPQSKAAKIRPLPPILPRPELPPNLPSVPPSFSHFQTNEHDAIYLSHFRHNLLPFLLHTSRNGFWECTVMQASTTEISVRHAVLALGALSLSYSDARPHVLNGPVYVDDQHLEAAHFHSALAMADFLQMTARDETQVRITIITGLLLLAFELLKSSIERVDNEIVHILGLLHEVITKLPGMQYSLDPHSRSSAFSSGNEARNHRNSQWRTMERLIPWYALISPFATPQMQLDPVFSTSYDTPGRERPPPLQYPMLAVEIYSRKSAYNSRVAEFAARYIWLNTVGVDFDMNVARAGRSAMLVRGRTWCEVMDKFGLEEGGSGSNSSSRLDMSIIDFSNLEITSHGNSSCNGNGSEGSWNPRLFPAVFLQRCLDRTALSYEGFEDALRMITG